MYLGNYVARQKLQGKELPSMFQQMQYPLKDLKNITGKGVQGTLLRGNAVLYLRHALGIELYRNIRYKLVNKLSFNRFIKTIIRPVIYGIGAGMFINLRDLKNR